MLSAYAIKEIDPYLNQPPRKPQMNLRGLEHQARAVYAQQLKDHETRIVEAINTAVQVAAQRTKDFTDLYVME